MSCFEAVSRCSVVEAVEVIIACAEVNRPIVTVFVVDSDAITDSFVMIM